MHKHCSPLALALAGAMAVTLTQVSPAQRVVTLDARVHGPSNPVTVALGAGCWKITPVAPAGGGSGAWHAWGGNNRGCGPTGTECQQGWGTLFWVGSSRGNLYGGTGFFATEALAMANTARRTMWLPQAETVRFAVADHALRDNLGGMALRIEPLSGCGNPATVVPYGTGTSGSAGIPSLGASGMPFLGDESFELRLGSAASNATLAWVVGAGRGNVSLPQFGAVLLVQPILLDVPGVTDASGNATLPIPLACELTSLCGARATCQAVVLDTAGTGGLAFTGGLELTVGS